MKPESAIYSRRSIRLKGYDYSSAGAYFVTICTQNRECLFGEVVDEEMSINEIGTIVQAEWMRTADIRSNVLTDQFIIMPNHIHGIWYLIERDDGRGVLQYATTESQFRSPSQTIGAIVRGFKSAATKQINESRGTPGKPVWQRNYFERVIRDEDELNRIREYIIYNPLKWADEQENPKNWK